MSRGRRRGGRALTAAGVPPLLAKDDFPTGFPLIPKLAYKKLEIKDSPIGAPWGSAGFATLQPIMVPHERFVSQLTSAVAA